MAKIRVPVALGLVLLVLPGWARAADPDQVDEAKKFLTLEARAKAILFFMHPTAEYRSLTFAGQTKVVDGERRELEGWFCLEYRFNWKSGLFDDSNYTYLKVFFDDRGKLHSLQPGRTSSFVDPFTAANIVVTAVKDKVIEAFEDDPDSQKVVRRLIEDSDAKGLLTFLLKADQR